MATNRSVCVKCGKQKATFKCEGCFEGFCNDHVIDHRQELSKQLDEVELMRDTIQEKLIEQITEPQKHALIQQINQWERDAINKIRETAEECRQLLVKYNAERVTQKEIQLNQLTDLLQQSRLNDDFIETDLSQWKDELTRIKKQLANPWSVKIRQSSRSLVDKIDINIISKCINRI
jgi:Tfp pilus assembly protein PilV